MIQVRGDLIELARRYAIERFPPDVFAQILERISDPHRKVLSVPLDPDRMYPLELYQELLEAFQRIAGPDALAQCGIHQAEKQLSGLFGLVARMSTRSMLINGMNRMWRSVFDRGELELVANEPEHVVLRVHDFQFAEAHLRISEPYLARLVELAEKRLVRCKARRLGPGETDFDFDL